MSSLQEIEQALKHKQFLSVRDIAHILSVSRSTAYNIFKVLIDCEEHLRIRENKKLFCRIHKSVFLQYIKDNLQGNLAESS